MTLREIIAMAAGRIVMLRRQMSLRPGTAVPGFSGLALAPWMRDVASAPQGTRLCSS